MHNRCLDIDDTTTMKEVLSFIDQPVRLVFYAEYLTASSYEGATVRFHAEEPDAVPKGCLWSYSPVCMAMLFDMLDYIKGTKRVAFVG